jgi:hypothetical protein
LIKAKRPSRKRAEAGIQKMRNTASDASRPPVTAPARTGHVANIVLTIALSTMTVSG